MRMVLAGFMAVGLAGQTLAAHAAVAGAPCSGALRSLDDGWHAAAYPDPSKPAQQRVLGKDGHENTGGQVLFMKTQIRLASIDCQEGRNDEALARVATVRRLLGQPRAAAAGR